MVDNSEIISEHSCTQLQCVNSIESIMDEENIGNGPAKKLICYESSIAKLNEDCLLAIFSFLSPLDRLIAEQVSQKWGRLMWHSATYLNLDIVFDYGKPEENVNYTKILQQLLKRYSKTMRTFEITKPQKKHQAYIHNILQEFCDFTKLQNLNLLGVSSYSKDVKTIAKHCNNLKEIQLNKTTGVKDDIFEILFTNNKQLKSVTINNSDIMTGTCLQYLPKHLKTLCFNSCRSLQLSTMLIHLVRLSEIKSFGFDCNLNFSSSALAQIFEILPKLSTLSVSFYLIIARCPSLEIISSLKYLTSLKLIHNLKLNNSILSKICESCLNLKYINLTHCSKLSDDALLSISMLPQLEVLYLSFLSIHSFANVLHVAKNCSLRRLVVKRCNSFNDDAALDTFEYSKHLEFLDMNGCGLISKSTLKNAVKHLNKEPYRKTFLELNVTDTSISSKEVEDYKHPFLKVIRHGDFTTL